MKQIHAYISKITNQSDMWRNMWRISFSSFALCFFSFFFLGAPLHNKISTINALSVDIINQTCKKCAHESTVSYAFCSSSLQQLPVSHVTNLEGLAIISMEMALENATNTLSSIKNLSSSQGPFDPFAWACLEDCLELYSDAVVTLVDGVAAFLTGRYDVANVKVSAVMEASRTCEEGFTEMEEDSPLTGENYSLFQFCDIALCIIQLLSLALHRS